MERVSTQISRSELLKQPDEQWNATVTAALSKCSLHFRQELTDVDFEIYLSGLRTFSAERISESLERCLKECEFMPKLKEICDRMPQEITKAKAPDLTVVREWDEPYSHKMKIHYVEYESGYRQARFVPVAQ